MESGQSYHIYNHANGSENIFREEENYRFFLQQYDKYLGGVVDTYAYCLMPNHFHFLVGVKHSLDLPGFQNLAGLDRTNLKASEFPITKAFSNFFNSYTKAFNKKYQRKGSLFIKNFKRKPILTQSQWQDTFLYIHLNPIKHDFAKDLKNWKWSSFHGYERVTNLSKLERSYFLNYFDSWQHVSYLLQSKRELIMSEDKE
jgi:REP element-mobilizing transposase RayT